MAASQTSELILAKSDISRWRMVGVTDFLRRPTSRNQPWLLYEDLVQGSLLPCFGALEVWGVLTEHVAVRCT